MYTVQPIELRVQEHVAGVRCDVGLSLTLLIYLNLPIAGAAAAPDH